MSGSIHQSCTFVLQEVAGQDKARPAWQYYYDKMEGLIFVVDCGDRHRIDEAKEALHNIINNREMKDTIVLILANKQDLPNGKILITSQLPSSLEDHVSKYITALLSTHREEVSE